MKLSSFTGETSAGNVFARVTHCDIHPGLTAQSFGRRQITDTPTNPTI